MDSAPRRSSFAWFSSSKAVATVPAVPAVPADPLLAFSSEDDDVLEQAPATRVEAPHNQNAEKIRNKT